MRKFSQLFFKTEKYSKRAFFTRKSSTLGQEKTINRKKVPFKGVLTDNVSLGPLQISYKATSFCFAKTINLNDLNERLIQYKNKTVGTENLIIHLNNNEFVHFSPFGSAVFFSSADSLTPFRLDILELAKKSCEGFIPEKKRSTDVYNIVVEPTLASESQFLPNILYLKEMNSNFMFVIGSLLGKSVVFAQTEAIIGDILQEYKQLSSVTVNKGARINNLFRRTNDSLFYIMSTLKILDRSRLKESAWQDDKYYQVWDALRSDLELEDRWEIINIKTDFMKDNMKFEIDIFHGERSMRLEKIIIILIALELLATICEWIGIPETIKERVTSYTAN